MQQPNKLEKKNEIEDILLGVCISTPEYALDILSKLEFEMLTEKNQELYSALCDLGKSKYNDSQTLLNALKLMDFEVLPYYKKASSFIGSEETVKILQKQYYDLLVCLKTESLLRKKLMDLQNTTNGLDVAMDIIKELEALSEKTSLYQNVPSLYQEYDSLVERLIEQRNSNNSGSLKSSKYPTVNKMTKGIKGGNIVIVSGAYKQGKTTFSLQWLLDLVETNNIGAAVFSLEMTKEELHHKNMAVKAEVPSERFREPQLLSDYDIQKIRNAKSKFSRGAIYTFDKYFSELHIKAQLRQLKRSKNIKLGMVDYLGLIEPTLSLKKDTREQQVSYISRFFKATAKELDIPIILLAQLNREGIENPSSSKIAESIGIARDADFLFTIYKPLDIGEKRVTVGEYEFSPQENDFLLCLDSSRHTKGKVVMPLRMTETGEFLELDLRTT